MDDDALTLDQLPVQGWVRWYIWKDDGLQKSEVQVVPATCECRWWRFWCDCKEQARKRRLTYILDQRQRHRDLGYKLTPITITPD